MHGTTYGGWFLTASRSASTWLTPFADPQVVVHLHAGRARLIGRVDMQFQDPAAPLDLGIDQRQQVGERGIVFGAFPGTRPLRRRPGAAGGLRKFWTYPPSM